MKKIISLVLLVCMLLSINSYAANDTTVNDLTYTDIGFYSDAQRTNEIGKISEAADKVYVRVSLSNTTHSGQSNAKTFSDVNVIAATYENGKFSKVSMGKKSIAPDQNVFYDIDVEKTSNTSEVKVFVWNYSDIKPYFTVKTLDTVSHECRIKSFSIGEAEGIIDELNKKVTVLVPGEDDLTNLTANAVLFDGATGSALSNDFSAPVNYTVTAEDGSTSTYTVNVVQNRTEKVGMDFDSDTIGTITTNTDSLKYANGTTVSKSAEIAGNAENQYLLFDDTSADTYINMYYDFSANAVDLPCEVSFKVKYERNASFSSGTNDASYGWILVSNGYSDIVGGISLKDTATKQTLMYRSTNSNGTEKTNCTLSLGNWIDVKMICKEDGNVDYYINGENILTATAATANVTSVNRITAGGTAKGRINKLYIDDIKVKAYVPEVVISEDFEKEAISKLGDAWGFANNTTNTWAEDSTNISIAEDNGNKVLQLVDSSDKSVAAFIDFAALDGSFELSYKYKSDGDKVSYVWNALQSTPSSNTVFDTGWGAYFTALCPNTETENSSSVWQTRTRNDKAVNMGTTPAFNDGWNSVKMVCSKNNNQYSVDYYINGAFAGNGVVLNNINPSRLSFCTNASRKCNVYIDDIKLVKLN